ncbi:MAG: hypothetical protein ACI9LY_002276 [Arenicella sp.]
MFNIDPSSSAMSDVAEILKGNIVMTVRNGKIAYQAP